MPVEELPVAVTRSPSLSAEERRRFLREGLWIHLFAATTLGFAFGLALWVWVTGRWETLAVILGVAVATTLVTFVIVASSARWLVAWFPTASPVLLVNGARGGIAYVTSLPVVWALPSLLGEEVMPGSVAGTYPYVGGVVILLAVTSLGLYSRAQVEAAERAKAAMELEAALEELCATRQQMVRSGKLAAMGELAAGVAHEINNPLNSVIGFAQLLMDEGELGDQARSDVEKILAEAQRAGQIVHNLLAFAGQSEPERVPVDLCVVIDRACALKSYDLSKHHIELRTEAPSVQTTVRGDEQQLVEVMLNLLANAEQAIARTGRPGVITVGCEAIDQAVLVSVSDDGPGIPPEVIGRIFEPFFTTKEAGEGTGLGLSVSRGIVRQHQGDLWAESTPGGGATFSIRLPAWDAQPAPPPPPRVEEPPPARMHILVVDDEPNSREFMTRVLARDGHVVDTASSGDDAWVLVQSTHFDCVVVDLRMPGMDGQELHRRTGEADPDQAGRFIFVTGDTVGDETHEFLKTMPAASRLMKPLDAGELRRRVAGLLEGRAEAETHGSADRVPDDRPL